QKFLPYKTYTNRIKNAIIKANRAIASVKANPKIAYLNISSFNDGFLAILGFALTEAIAS
ncbi:MAG TPA: hypothetical protein PLC61_06160, partial [Chitinophagales bacterium]|nr:hypothetical protein [Chitinophagales bacterium]